MDRTLEALGINKLNTADRLKLIGLIWDSISEEVEGAPLTEAQQFEVERRLTAHKANPQDAIPWDQVEARIRQRLCQ